MSSEDVKIETSFSDAQDRPIFDHSKLTGFLKQYSFDDLAKAFLAVHLWLPNIASTVKLQYAYVTLESICRELSSENKIRTYENFRRFCEEFFRLLPSFETLEDFVPETDWGEIEYFFQDQRYRIFYGSELCNAYDFYYGFEIVFAELDIEWGDGFSIPPKRSPGVQFCTAFGTTPAEYSESCFIFRCPVRWPFCSRNNPWTMQSTAT